MKLFILAIVATTAISLVAGDYSSTKMVNAGIGGNNTKQGLKRFDKTISASKPDIVIIFFGMNDSVNDHNSVPLERFKSNLAKMVDKARSAKATPFLVTIHPVIEETLYFRHKKNLKNFYLDRGGANKIIDSYNDMTMVVAKEKNVQLIDFAKIAKEVNAKAGENVIVKSDGVHLSENGKQALGAVVADALKRHSDKTAGTILCFGDSITYYGYMTEVLKILDPLRFPIYATNVKSAKRHPDTTPSSKLFDGRANGISTDSVEYPEDVEISIDLRHSRMVTGVEVAGFNGGDHKICEITLYVGNDKSKLKKHATLAPEKKFDRKVKSYAFQLNEKIRYLKIIVKKDKSAKRLLLSEVVINE